MRILGTGEGCWIRSNEAQLEDRQDYMHEFVARLTLASEKGDPEYTTRSLPKGLACSRRVIGTRQVMRWHCLNRAAARVISAAV